MRTPTSRTSLRTLLGTAAAAAALALSVPVAGAATAGPTSSTSTTGTTSTTGAVSAAPSTTTVTKLSQSQAASQLSAAGITWSSSGGCTTRSNSTCTSFDQVNDTTVQGIITLKQASGCAINITGGTEVGHASGTYSHYNGYKLDIAHSSCIDGYIHSAFTQIADRGDGYPQWQAGSGNLYCDEGSHWDITYLTCGCKV